MSFICGMFFGFVIGLFFWAFCSNVSEKNFIEQGTIKIDGKIYKLTKIDIQEENK